MPDGVCCFQDMLEIESSLDHVYGVKKLPAEELDEFRDELAVLSDHHGSLVRVAAYMSV